MEENIMNEVVEKAEEQLVTAAENLDKAIANVQPTVAPKSFGMKNILIGGGLTLGGAAIGFAVDRWGLPALSNWWDDRKAKKEKKKAEKKAKAEAKKAAKEKKPAEALAPATNDADSTPDEKKD